jgi:arylsulfatase A-like enzyme
VCHLLPSPPGLWNRTLFVFTSDNGAPDPPPQESGASNWPLRGGKFTPYEGGTRVPGFVHSPLLPAARRGTTFAGKFHIIDWTRTFVEVGGGRGEHLRVLRCCSQMRCLSPKDRASHPRRKSTAAAFARCRVSRGRIERRTH